MRFSLRSLLLITIVAGVLYATARFVSYLSTPAPVRAFQSTQSLLQPYAEAVLAGSTPKRDDGDYVVPEWLQRTGAHYVRIEDGCVLFLFESLPPDALPMLVYSPNGYKGLPFRDREGRNELVHLEYLDASWFYCLRD
jgi:hypothetical protein